VALSVVITACAPLNKDDYALGAAADAIKEPIKLMDERFFIYESALDNVSRYVSEPSDEKLKIAKITCIKAIGDIAEQPSASMELDEEVLKNMMDIGINTADFRVPFEYADYYKNENIRTLTLLLDYLNMAPEENETLSYITDLNIKYQTINRKVEYICINELFCGFGGKTIDDFKTFLSGLSSLGADKLPWETDSAALEAKADKLLLDAEKDIDAYALMIGKLYQAHLSGQTDYSGLLLDAGYSESEADKIVTDITAISEKAALIP
jgi:hypothetical protein